LALALIASFLGGGLAAGLSVGPSAPAAAASEGTGSNATAGNGGSSDG
jgi:hypothetical protein